MFSEGKEDMYNLSEEFCENITDEFPKMYPSDEVLPLFDLAAETDYRNDHTLYDCSNFGDFIFSPSPVSSNYDVFSGPPNLMDLVDPNDIQPYEAHKYSLPQGDPFLSFPSPKTLTAVNSVLSEDDNLLTNVTDLISYIEEDSPSEKFLPPSEKFLSSLPDEFLGEIMREGQLIHMDGVLPDTSKGFTFPIKEEPEQLIANIKKEPVELIQDIKKEPEECILRIHSRPYHPDCDHSYYSKSVYDSETSGSTRGWTSMGSPDSSGSSSEEVDVVTVTEEPHSPVVPKAQSFYQISRSRRKASNKPERGKQIPQMLKSFDEAMKRNMKRVTTVRRTYRRKVNNSVETTPSNSAPSSRCSSDVEDAGKRKHHNTSERKRRQNLKICLTKLQNVIPGVMNNPKAPKVQVLQAAKDYVMDLKNRHSNSLMTLEKEKRKEQLLIAKLKKLRREAAKKS